MSVDLIKQPFSENYKVYEDGKEVSGLLYKNAFDGFSKITVGTIEPISPEVGDLWIDTT